MLLLLLLLLLLLQGPKAGTPGCRYSFPLMLFN
jgi:hypothetical protein